MYVLPVTVKCHSFGLKYILGTGVEDSTKKGEVTILLGKYMDEYILDGTRTYNADLQFQFHCTKSQKMLHRNVKRATLYNAGCVAFTDCAKWTECVTCSVVGAEGMGQSIP
jgi:hypothetical protein